MPQHLPPHPQCLSPWFHVLPPQLQMNPFITVSPVSAPQHTPLLSDAFILLTASVSTLPPATAYPPAEFWPCSSLEHSTHGCSSPNLATQQPLWWQQLQLGYGARAGAAATATAGLGWAGSMATICSTTPGWSGARALQEPEPAQAAGEQDRSRTL